MKCFRPCLFLLLGCLIVFLPSFLCGADVEVGDSQATVESKLGKPKGVASSDGETDLLYERGQVVVVDGKVKSVTFSTGGQSDGQKEQEDRGKGQQPSGTDVRVGDSRATVEAKLGKPKGVASSDGEIDLLYQWGHVIMVDGKVTSRDLSPAGQSDQPQVSPERGGDEHQPVEKNQQERQTTEPATAEQQAEVQKHPALEPPTGPSVNTPSGATPSVTAPIRPPRTYPQRVPSTERKKVAVREQPQVQAPRQPAFVVRANNQRAPVPIQQASSHGTTNRADVRHNIPGIIVLFLPLVIGGVIAAINADELNDLVDKLEVWLRRRKQRLAEKRGWFSKYVVGPLLWAIVAVCDWTNGFLHRGLKTGVRVTAMLYAIGAWLMLLYVALIVVVTIVVMIVIFYVICAVAFGSNGVKAPGFSPTNAGRAVDDGSPEEREAPQHATVVPPVIATPEHGEEENKGSGMGRRFEFERVTDPSVGIVSGLLSALPGEDSSKCWKCTIYDGDTDKKLSEGLGNTEFDAKWEAQAKL